MRTRSGISYLKPEMGGLETETETEKRKRSIGSRKRQRRVPEIRGLDDLPDDLVLSILSKLSSSADSPSDLVNVTMICKRMNGLGLNPIVLSKASPKSLTIGANKWSDSAHRFLNRCVDAGSLEAFYTLGMINFYCLKNRAAGASLLARAARRSHAVALYALAIIQFNGSGRSKSHKDLRTGAALCARSAYLGHTDALRELGHCLQDGYGVRQNVAEGRRLLFQVNARELAVSVSPDKLNCQPPQHLLSDFGGNIPAPEVQPVNRFLLEWFGSRPVGAEGLRPCSYGGCGRPETRKHEFRRCSVCGKVSYCSRVCQALHWKLEHKEDCKPMEQWRDNTGIVVAPFGMLM